MVSYKDALVPKLFDIMGKRNVRLACVLVRSNLPQHRQEALKKSFPSLKGTEWMKNEKCDMHLL